MTMRSRASPTWGLLPALLFGALAVPAEEFGRSVDEDTTLVRTCVTTVELELVEMSATVNGEELPEEAGLEFEMSIAGEYTIVVRDVYGEPGAARPASLVRTFESIEGEEFTSSSSVDGDEEERASAGSELEGRTVEFSWSEMRAAYDVEFLGEQGGEQGSEELLDEIWEDMDLRAFLPEGDVSEGDSWSVEPAAFELVNYPGGVDTVTDAEDESDEVLEELLDAAMDGEIEATFQGTRDEDGIRVAVIFVTALLRTEAESAEDFDGTPVTQTVSYELDLEGELLWDLAGGHLHAFALAGRMELETIDEASQELGGEELEFVQSMRLRGEVEYLVAVERE